LAASVTFSAQLRRRIAHAEAISPRRLSPATPAAPPRASRRPHNALAEMFDINDDDITAFAAHARHVAVYAPSDLRRRSSVHIIARTRSRAQADTVDFCRYFCAHSLPGARAPRHTPVILR